MRIAVSGAHRTGKTTLVAELAAQRPGWTVIDEPYYLLEDEGHLFAERPNVDDFEQQLERAVRSLRDSDAKFPTRRAKQVAAYLAARTDG